MRDLLTVVLLCGAVYRATRFVTHDALLSDWRDPLEWWLDRRGWWVLNATDRTVGDPFPGVMAWCYRKLSYLLTCGWCVSVWASGLIVYLTCRADVDVPLPWLMWPTASAVTGLIISRESKS